MSYLEYPEVKPAVEYGRQKWAEVKACFVREAELSEQMKLVDKPETQDEYFRLGYEWLSLVQKRSDIYKELEGVARRDWNKFFFFIYASGRD